MPSVHAIFPNIYSLSLSLSYVVAKERLIFLRETASNSYRTLAYSIAHFLVHLPVLAVLALIYCSGSYWIVGLQPNFIAFTYWILVILVAMAVGQAIVVMTSAATDDLQIGNAIVTALLALMFYFGGFFITLNDVRIESNRVESCRVISQ